MSPFSARQMPLTYEAGLLLFLTPALIVGIAAQLVVRSTCGRTRARATGTSGYAAARRILDGAGLAQVGIEQIPGTLSDHYDPRRRTLHLSGEVFHGRTCAAVGIAAHEAGHAVQHAARYRPLAIRHFAVPAASYGSGACWLLLLLGLVVPPLRLPGILLFGLVVLLQAINLPGERNASRRAGIALVETGLVAECELPDVQKMLDAAALIPIAATLQGVLTLGDYGRRWVWPGARK